MERFDISEGGRLAEMVYAAERGEEVEIMRDGEVVAHVSALTRSNPSDVSPDRRMPLFDLAEWEDLHRLTAPLLLGGDMAAELRAMRDED